MNKIVPFLALALLGTNVLADNADPVVMTVAGTDVHQSEFEYFLNKNRNSEEKMSVLDYAETYVNFKLKVQAAVDAGIDTTASFLSEFTEYRDMQAIDYMLDSAFLESVAHGSYEQSVREVGPDGLSFVSVLSRIPEDSSPEEFVRCNALIDSIRNVLRTEGNFHELAQRFSNDNYAKNGGDVGWMARSQLPEDIARVVFSLEEGTISEPFIFEGAPMIVAVFAHRELGSYEENRDDIYEWMNSREEIMMQAMANKALDYSEQFDWGITDPDSATLFMHENLEDYVPEFRNISREYHDGLLLFEISNREVWEKAMNDEAGMERFYNEHLKLFRFKEPCFKGMVFFCKDEDVFHRIEQAVSGLPVLEWSDTIVSFNHGESVVRAMRGNQETGIFQKGQNAYVDCLVFGEGEFEPMKSFPYTNVIGRVLDKPESMNDVAAQVSQEYQNSLEKEWVKSLRKKYKFKINKKELRKLGN